MRMWELLFGDSYIKPELNSAKHTLEGAMYLYLEKLDLMQAAYFSIVVTWAEVLRMKCNLHKLVRGR